MLLSLKNLIQDPFFNFVTTIVTTVFGVISSYYFYKRGKRDGDKSAKHAQKMLEEANEKVRILIDLAEKNGIKASSIEELLKIRTYDFSETDEMIINRFKTLIDAGKGEEAEKYYLAKKSNIKVEAYGSFIEGTICYLKKDYQGAAKLFSAATNIGDEDYKHISYFNLGTIYLVFLRQFDLAIQALLRAHKLKPESGNYATQLGVAFTEINDFKSAKKYYDIAEKIDPNDPGYLRCVLMFFAYNKDVENVILYTERAIAAGVAVEECAPFVGDAYLHKGEYSKAIYWYEKILNKDPGRKVPIINSIFAYIHLGGFSHAELLCERYLKYYPHDLARIFDSYSGILMIKGHHSEIIKLSKGLDLFSNVLDHAAGINNLGYAYLAMNRFKESKECFSNILIVDPLHYNALNGMATYFIKSDDKDLDQALNYYGMMYKINPGDVELLTNMAKLYSLRQEHEQVVFFCEKALAIENEFNAANELLKEAKSKFSKTQPKNTN